MSNFVVSYNPKPRCKCSDCPYVFRCYYDCGAIKKYADAVTEWQKKEMELRKESN